MSDGSGTAPASTPAAFAPAAFHELPLGAIEPRGWLRDQLRLQADGLTGHLDEIWPDVGPDSAWLGGDGEDWERGPYYCEGLISLAYLPRDTLLLAKAQRWLDSVLASQRVDGQFGPTTNDDWWPRMVMLKVLAQYHDATSDPRVLPFMLRYCHYQYAHLPQRPLRDWGRARGADNALVVYWLFERANEEFLLGLADLILAQTEDWGPYMARSLPHDKVTTF